MGTDVFGLESRPKSRRNERKGGEEEEGDTIGKDGSSLPPFFPSTKNKDLVLLQWIETIRQTVACWRVSALIRPPEERRGGGSFRVDVRLHGMPGGQKKTHI